MSPFLIAVASFIAIVLFLTAAHEMGHYLAGRAMGIVPKSFSVGMGREIVAVRDRHGTRWKLSWLPIGGYVQFHGEMHPSASGDRIADARNDFSRLSRSRRSFILAAGPAVNLLVAAIVFAGISMWSGRLEISSTVREVAPAGAAYESGIRPGDRIASWNGDDDFEMQELLRYVKINPGRTVEIETTSQDGPAKSHQLSIREREYADAGGNAYRAGSIGMAFSVSRVPMGGIGEMLGYSISETASLVKLQGQALAQIAVGSRSLEEISGPARMAQASGQQAAMGLLPYLYFTALVSIAIAMMNLLPIPGLDGGYLAINAFEAVIGRDIGEKAMKNLVVGGYGALSLLIGLAVVNDFKAMILG